MTTFPCTTAPHLFDSMGGPDDPSVRAAKALCHTCPAVFTCRQQGREGREWGVWGGESQVERNQAVGVLEDDDRPECGSYSSLQLHRALGEKCETCLEARRTRERMYDAKRRAGEKLTAKKERAKAVVGPDGKAPCPSYAAYKRHRRRKEDPGPCGCRDAYNEARRAERNADKPPQAGTECPSRAGFVRHQRKGEDAISCGCKKAHSQYYKDRRAARKKQESVA
ncbi:WhiB family transcriptional regulator [Streptomyces sp. NPDC088727]|uniref:WhiB family transcriptional regulator n=1 Tax=Streptomyces sp. NPDC088727 TaxID=3365875 RepID=UPI0037F317C2